jgi:hypothetical protein
VTIFTQLIVRGWDELVAGLEVLPARMAAENEIAMRESTLHVEGEIKSLTPRKTGRLFSAWGSQVTGFGFDTVGLVGNTVSYGPFVEENTSAHDIVANGNALMIPINPLAGSAGYSGSIFGGAKLAGGLRAHQQFILRKRVRHPGTTGKHMMREGARNAAPGVRSLFTQAMKRALSVVK